jgi:hypothetical protein
MEGNGWNEVVKTRRGNFQPLESGDTVLDAQGAQIWPVAAKTLAYEPMAGDNIAYAARESIKLSKQNSKNVRFKFNDVTVEVTPETKVDDAVQFYMDEIKRQGEAYRNSPEGKQAAADALARAEESAKRDAAVDTKIEGVTLELANKAGWDEFVANNQDGYGKGVIDFAERWAKLMQVELAAGKKLSDIADTTSHEADNEGITGFMYGAAVSTLSQTWKHGEQLRRWHNKETQLGNEGDIANEKGGVLNPAVLRLG